MSFVDLEAQADALPACPGVYFFYDRADRLLYVGKSVNLRARVRSYLRADGGHTRRTARLKDEAARIAHVACGSELEALLLESRLIKQRQPLYNVMGRRYRHYPFIKIPNEPLPRVLVTYELQDDGGRYYGPFSSETRIHEALDAMRPLFRWRSCQPLAKRPCFEHGIGRCAAPCVGDEAGYDAAIAALEAFLSGGGEPRLQQLHQEMAAAAEALQFERAAILRDRLTRLRPLVQRQTALQAAISELDCLVVLPDVAPGRYVWLVLRRGRLVHTLRDVTPRQRVRLSRQLERILTAPPPGLNVRQEELDEVNLLANWLYRHGEDQAISLVGRRVDEAVARACDAMRPQRAIAERVQTRVVRAPD
ncbi:MAG TPA: GIY-YIG nuclease family protein [Oscillatoriaceae cyanobacterium]